MTRTLTGEFATYEDARAAVDELEAVGVPRSAIALVAANHGPAHDGDRATLAAEDAGAGIGIGAVVGGAGGLLAGLGALTLPVVGPVVAAGWLVSTAVGVVAGATAGAAAGGLLGALVHAGVPEGEAGRLVEGVRAGGALVTVKADERFETVAQEILRGERASSVRREGEEKASGGGASAGGTEAAAREQIQGPQSDAARTRRLAEGPTAKPT